MSSLIKKMPLRTGHNPRSMLKRTNVWKTMGQGTRAGKGLTTEAPLYGDGETFDVEVASARGSWVKIRNRVSAGNRVSEVTTKRRGIRSSVLSEGTNSGVGNKLLSKLRTKKAGCLTCG